MDSRQNEFRNKRYELLILAVSIISLVNILMMFIPLKEELHPCVNLIQDEIMFEMLSLLSNLFLQTSSPLLVPHVLLNTLTFYL